ncbi:hypothetical protein ADICYQ_0067 [Cyclobacterium qasimii M12-11B]|uniref:Uncharacterized protein n=1 Tax=Cyclobacterium qasimii M12-11B TaxID=641524 RepID=S7WYG1_9BACT|nr:hypothetical protein ADICYQ_0067 [Cyclobacterium qasimii M12-11B]
MVCQIIIPYVGKEIGALECFIIVDYLLFRMRYNKMEMLR